MPERRLGYVGHILAAADSGLVQLSPESQALRKAHGHLLSQINSIKSPATASDLNADIRTACLAGKPLPSAAAMVAREAEIRAAHVLRQCAREEVDSLESEIHSSLVADPNRTVTDVLRPSHTRVTKEVRRCLRLLDGQLEHSQLLEAPDDVRKARVDLDRLVSEYLQLRRAYHQVESHMSFRHDSQGRFAEFKDAERLPKVSPNTGKKPWPSEPVQRLNWFVTNDYQPWVPTSTERDERCWETMTEFQRGMVARGTRLIGAG